MNWENCMDFLLLVLIEKSFNFVFFSQTNKRRRVDRKEIEKNQWCKKYQRIHKNIVDMFQTNRKKAHVSVFFLGTARIAVYRSFNWMATFSILLKHFIFSEIDWIYINKSQTQYSSPPTHTHKSDTIFNEIISCTRTKWFPPFLSKKKHTKIVFLSLLSFWIYHGFDKRK